MFAPPSAPSVSRSGYVFLGYYTEASGGKQIYGENLNCVYSVWPYVENVTLYAHWVRLSNVTFMSDGNQVGSVATAQQGKALPAAPTGATKAGYGFLGYFTEATGGTMVYDESLNAVPSAWDSTQDVTLYAQWIRLSNITFMSDGNQVGSVATAQQGKALPQAPEATKTDYAFLGYFTEAIDGTRVYDASRNPVQSVWNSTEDVTLYAHWQPVSVPFVVMLVSEGVTVGMIDNARQGSAIASVAVPEKANHKFLGYWTAETLGNKVFNEDGSPVESTWTYYENVTLYAHWELSKINFTFVSAGTEVGTSNYEVDNASSTVPHASRSGDYVFLGYFTEAVGGAQVFDANYDFVQGSLSSLTQSMTLYAHWAIPEGSVVKLVYRGQLNLLTGVPAVHNSAYTKTMHFRVYDGEDATTPLWQTRNEGVDVTVNADGSFVYAFGDEDLASLIATGLVTHVGLALGQNASTAVEMKPRRKLRPVAAVNRALTAEGAALDIRIGNLVTENAVVAADATVSQLEVTGTVTAPGAGKVSVSPLVVGPDERTRLLRGSGVKAFSRENPTVLRTPSGAVLRGQVLATAPSDGIALISSKATGRRALRCPAVIQYCKEREQVRAPTSEPGGLKVTFFPFVGKEGR